MPREGKKIQNSAKQSRDQCQKKRKTHAQVKKGTFTSYDELNEVENNAKKNKKNIALNLMFKKETLKIPPIILI